MAEQITEVQGYKKEKVTIDIVKANIVGFVSLIPTTIIFGLPYFLIWGKEKIQFPDGILWTVYMMLIMILGVVVHELIHGIVWAKYAKKGFKSIKFGVIWKMLTPYCHCKEPLKVKEYIYGAIAPAIVLGFIPAIIGVISGDFYVLLFGILFIITAVGDFMVINLIRKENREDLVQDHPSEVGFFIFRKDKTSSF